ncbi:MAG: hypothetical protein UZ16_OP3001000415 [Candidatus Hinthialibacteria bacterium OLB16]|nr:MAG: hypothetical protein UZ16_OP3001000415 [Candidatus Hinthialibacteria bacterium OLB16]
MGLTALAILFGGGYLLAFRPLYNEYKSLDMQIADIRKDWEKTKEQYVRSKQYRAEFERIRESLSIEGSEQEKKERINAELTRLLEESAIIPSSQIESNPERIDDDFKIYSFHSRQFRLTGPHWPRFCTRSKPTPLFLKSKA